MTGDFVGRGNQYIQFIKVLYCKLPTIGKQLQTFPHKIWGLNRQPQRWKVSVLSLRHRGPILHIKLSIVCTVKKCSLFILFQKFVTFCSHMPSSVFTKILRITLSLRQILTCAHISFYFYSQKYS